MPIHLLKLIDQTNITPSTILFRFQKPSNFQYKPGQYGGFTLINPKELAPNDVTRRFSLFSSPDDPYLAILTRMQKSGYKQNLAALKPDDEIKFAGPTGIFTLHNEIEIPTVLIAGGIGIAPFHSMIQYHLKHDEGREIYLFYGNQSTLDAPFLETFKALEKDYANFHFIPTMDQGDTSWQGETGYISHVMIKKYIKDYDVLPNYYVCGSPMMVTNLQETLLEMGITGEKIKVEDFPGY